ncbi:PASTA domain-containing protein [Chloracidobacterium sp. MS 40/45]|jgi:beta-lactam-binding protein with PASTA domain|uniref:PASTA domain-containing protein n=1 Tax=Chloracidobacterium aggregatum TaxID=2851959 RepID=UPI001B8CC162|nr:PASTA domain-containing protein [Chloracidobacterium aggregatum]QUV99154.1 PASTA domain-containing protein [Chloracidobacterium sp. MS 40/45]
MTSVVSGSQPQRTIGAWLKHLVWRVMFVSLLVLAFIAGSIATCYVTRGERVAVPNVVGKTEPEAREILEKQGLRVVIIEVPDAPEPVGTVVRQNPKAGSVVRRPFPVKINVSRAQ